MLNAVASLLDSLVGAFVTRTILEASLWKISVWWNFEDKLWVCFVQ